MIPNAVKRTWQDGRPPIDRWLSIGNPFTAEIMAGQGYDSLTVDIQHEFLENGEARGMMQAVRASGVTVMARVPWLGPGIVMKGLDAGAYGVICPMINVPDQAAQRVDVMRSPPRGSRSFGPTVLRLTK